MPANVQSSWAFGLIEDGEDLEMFDAELDEEGELDDLADDLDDDEDDLDDDLEDDEDDDLDDEDDDLIDLDDEFDDGDAEERPHPGKFEE